MKQVIANELRAAYEVEGKGPDVLLLHGWMASKRYWHAAAENLSSHRVWSLDLFGFGESEKPDRGYALDIYARFLLGFLDAVGVERCAIVGHSMGGCIAAWTVLASPRRFSAMCLVDPALAGLSTAPLRWSSEPVLGFMLRLADISRNLGQMTIGSMFGIGDYGSLIVLEEAKKASIHAAAACSDMMSRQTDWRGLSKLDIPTMVLYGRKDFLVDREMDKDIKSLMPDAEMLYIEDCSHMPMLERPDEFYTILRMFLEQHLTRPS